MTLEIKDVLSWNEFLKNSQLRNIYPPKSIDLYNRLIAHTRNFFLISAYGAFTPGYVMLISKELLPSMGMIHDSNLEEFKWLISKTVSLINKAYDRDVVYFEHGMCACVGGLDRAHLHFMTIKKNLDKEIIKKNINKVLVSRRAGINYVELKGHKLTNIHDITSIMDTTGPQDYQVNGNQIYYKDICDDLNLDTWPISTRTHSKKGGHYVYFKTNDSKSSFLTKRDFQTQLGRQIVFEIEKETNEEMNIFYKNEMNNNNFANIWKWQEFSFKKNMINTMIDLRPHLLDIKKNDSKFEFKTF
jgi:hypothetical protein